MLSPVSLGIPAATESENAELGLTADWKALRSGVADGVRPCITRPMQQIKLLAPEMYITEFLNL